MKYKYVAIEHEYGSSGNEIGRQLARQYHIPCYSQEILEQAGQRTGATAEQIFLMEENITDSLFYTWYVKNEQKHPSDIELHQDMQKAIETLASRGPAVFIGHSALKTLKGMGPTLSAFIYADQESRMQHAIMRDGQSPSHVLSILGQCDRCRSNYFYFNMHSDWTSLSNYDVALNSEKNGIQGCVAALAALLTDS